MTSSWFLLYTTVSLLHVTEELRVTLLFAFRANSQAVVKVTVKYPPPVGNIWRPVQSYIQRTGRRDATAVCLTSALCQTRTSLEAVLNCFRRGSLLSSLKNRSQRSSDQLYTGRMAAVGKVTRSTILLLLSAVYRHQMAAVGKATRSTILLLLSAVCRHQMAAVGKATRSTILLLLSAVYRHQMAAVGKATRSTIPLLLSAVYRHQMQSSRPTVVGREDCIWCITVE